MIFTCCAPLPSFAVGTAAVAPETIDAGHVRNRPRAPQSLLCRSPTTSIDEGVTMAHLKKCPYCKGAHRLKRAYLRCKRTHKQESWGK